MTPSQRTVRAVHRSAIPLTGMFTSRRYTRRSERRIDGCARMMSGRERSMGTIIGWLIVGAIAGAWRA